MRYLIVLLVLFSFNAIPADFYMSKLENDIKLREASTTKARTLCTAEKGASLEYISASSTTSRWIVVQTPDCRGHVAKSSVEPFVADLTHLQKYIGNITTIHRVVTEGVTKIIIRLGPWCYIVDEGNFPSIPEGKEDAVTVVEYLNNIGGMPKLSREDALNCNFQ